MLPPSYCKNEPHLGWNQDIMLKRKEPRLVFFSQPGLAEKIAGRAHLPFFINKAIIAGVSVYIYVVFYLYTNCLQFIFFVGFFLRSVVRVWGIFKKICCCFWGF